MTKNLFGGFWTVIKEDQNLNNAFYSHFSDKFCNDSKNADKCKKPTKKSEKIKQ